MAIEIERKFLVRGSAWKRDAIGIAFRQGYLSTVKERTVRVRTEGSRAVLTVKGLTVATRRAEFEYEIPLADAAQMLDDLCERPLIEKTRYRIAAHGRLWEIDEFHGDNEGLVVAEVELTDAADPIVPPAWLGAEVSADARYYNANLVAHPYRTWPREGSQ